MPLDVPKSPTSAAKSAAIELLGTCVTVSETARRINRNRKTVARWMQLPKFSAAVARRLDQFRQEHTQRIYRLCSKAIRTLKRNMGDLDHPSAANRAAITILTKAGLLTPDAPPKDKEQLEELSLGGSLEVMTPEEARKLPGGENVIVVLPDTESSSNADHPAGPRPNSEASSPPA